MICTSCLTTFFHDPMRIGIVIAAVVLSLIFILYSRKQTDAKKKIRYLYLHIFFLIFPIIFYIFFNGCNALLNSCYQIAPFLLVILISVISSVAFVSLLGPFLFIRRYIKKSCTIQDSLVNKIIKKHAKKLNIKKPAIHIINTAKPIAFSLSAITSKIFVSIGLIDILTKKELEAVLLHELGHIKHKSSATKFWTLFAQFLSPLAAFTHNNLSQEEMKADNVAIQSQQTAKFIESAKKKLSAFRDYHEIIQT